MGGELSTPACQIKSHVLWMKFEPGWLQLKDGLIAFKSEARGLLFRAPLAEVRASFPNVIFPVPYFGTGVKLAVNDRTYRLSFIRNFVQSQYIGWTSDSLGAEGSTSFGPTWVITREDAKPAKAAVQQWRAALGLLADRGH
jgi:hypothetical protein